MRPDDLALLRTPGIPAVAPDGRIAVVAVTRPDVGENGYRGRLWAVPTDASAPARPLTSGGCASHPAFSPDGRWLAYLAAADSGPPQVHVLPTAGGAPRRLTGAPLGAGAPVWSPDSRRLAWTAPTGGPADPDAPRLITPRRSRPDDLGPLADRRSSVHVLDLPDLLADDDAVLPVPRLVGDPDDDCTGVTWSPDGAALAVVARRAAGSLADLVVVRADGSDARRLVSGAAVGGSPAWAPSGDHVWLVTADAPGEASLCRVPVDGGTPEPVPVHGAVVAGPLVDGRGILVGVARRGAVELLRLLPAGGDPEVLVEGPFTVRGVASAGGVVVATVGHDGSAGELIAVTPGRRRLLTAFGSPLAATGRVHRATPLAASAADGSPAAGRVTVPPGAGPHPVLLHVRPGNGGWVLDDDVQVAVTGGLAVVQADEGDADAVLALLDAALEDPRLDAGRVGVAGGALAVELIRRSDRFAAAVLEFAPPDDPPADAVAAPTLVVCGERDLRGPGIAFSAELERRGVDTELLLFPAEGADLARSGRTAARVARHEHLLRWWARQLGAADRHRGRRTH
ncbi:PD40 domain-containing protein [Blastococcus sp. URHD0036]|uniref:S9 family peptidase n=1 Tax=Blastococcus sp. URHD0036 TaxID=1380356 RepID=UPI00068A0B6C|nr:PD40 domain-containing protein [Blastococcus sp. URHD0036]